MEREKLGQLLILTVAVLISYIPSYSADFVYDDHFQLVRNPYVRDFGNVKTLFTSDVWQFSKTMQSIYYRPFHMGSYLVLYKLFGMRPFPFHFYNVLLFLLCTLLLWRIFLHYVQPIPAFIGALLFAVHPVHVETVAWIAGTPDPLCGVFLFSSFLLLLRGKIALSLLPYAAALLSKEPAILFPGLVVADQWLFQRMQKKSFLLWLAGAGVLMIVYLLLRYNALGPLLQLNPETHVPLSVSQQILTGISFGGFYLLKLIYPATLNAYYDVRPPLPPQQLWWGLLIFVAFVSSVILFRKNRIYGFAAAWFLIFLIPAMLVRALSASLFAERYVYLSSAGFLLAIASLPMKRSTVVLLTIVAFIFSAQSYWRSRVWQNDLTLWQDTAKKSPQIPVVNYNLATAYFDRQDCMNAATWYRRATELQPNNAEAYYNLAVCNHNLGDDASAVRNLKLFLVHWKGDAAKRELAEEKLRQLLRGAPGSRRH